MTKSQLTDLFISFTNVAVASGEEHLYEKYMKSIGCVDDTAGNWILKIGESKSMFASHLDTVATKTMKIEHKWDGRFLKSNGKTILGADDKAGVCILLNMIEHQIPGTYVFFAEEECGGIGSSAMAKDTAKGVYDRVISFDRKGYNSIITSQTGICASSKFADALSEELAKYMVFMREDTTGVFTDSANFTEVVSECTNLSVGYFNQHTNNECQDMDFLHLLSEATLKVDWESLPAVRKPVPSYSYRHSAYNSSYGRYYDYGDDSYYNSYDSKDKSGDAYMTKRGWKYNAKTGLYDRPPSEPPKLTPTTKDKIVATYSESDISVLVAKHQTCDCDWKTARAEVDIENIYDEYYGDLVQIGCGSCGMIWAFLDPWTDEAISMEEDIDTTMDDEDADGWPYSLDPDATTQAEWDACNSMSARM